MNYLHMTVCIEICCKKIYIKIKNKLAMLWASFYVNVFFKGYNHLLPFKFGIVYKTICIVKAKNAQFPHYKHLKP